MGILSPVLPQKGYVDGFVVKYNSTTNVAITAGVFEANGKLYTLGADTTHALTSLASGADFHYIYLDDDTSAPSVPVFIDSITEPAFNDVKRGWYNGADRCAGVVYSPDASATIAMFAAHGNGKLISLETGTFAFPQMANNFVPNSATWQTPTVDGDVVTPVNASRIRMIMTNTDVGSIWLFAASKEHADVETNPNGGEGAQWREIYPEDANVIFKLNLGVSRQVRITGATGDDNNLGAFCAGFSYQR